ncbi:hypothetical protein D3C75_986400 [compost metagenome]
MGHNRCDNGGQYGGDGHNNHIFRMLDPAERVVAQQDVAYRTAAQCGSRGDNDHAKGVHPTSPGRQGTCHRFSGDPDQIQNVQQHVIPQS